MKKITIAIMAAVLVFAITACGRNRDTDPSSAPTTQPTTMPFMPEMDPTLDTNIPDPDINTETPTFTDGTDPADGSNSGTTS